MLTVKQRRELVKILERGPLHHSGGLWSSKEVKDLLKRKYKIEFVKQHVWRMLTQIGFSLQRPLKRHFRQPSEEDLLCFKKNRRQARY